MTAKSARKRANAAMKFPENTCGASSHAFHIADVMARGEDPGMSWTDEEVAESIYAVCEALWKARDELRKLGRYP